MFSSRYLICLLSSQNAHRRWGAARRCPRLWWLAALLCLGILIGGAPPAAQAAPHSWRYAESLATARSGHTATLLPDGRVLVVGGLHAGAVLASAEIYDPITETWSETGSLGAARSSHTATLLPNGQVLVVGGHFYLTFPIPAVSLASAELYDPATGTWSETGSLGTARSEHTATLLQNGQVLVAGGRYFHPSGSPSLTSAELYNPVTGTWSETGNLNYERFWHTATLLPGGQVLVIGGHYIDLVESYEPVTGMWSFVNSWDTRGSHTATLLYNGQVLAAGGSAYDPGDENGAALYDPATGLWRDTGFLNETRANHTATLLPNGQVLVAGGYGFEEGIRASVELYDPATEMWNETSSLGTGRSYHTATLLPNGQVLVVGGRDLNEALASVELYDPGDSGDVLEVTIDIKPGDYPNRINPASKGKLPVAVLTTAAFDAAAVDLGTIRFGATGTESAPVWSGLWDVDNDGDNDLLLHFLTNETGISCGDSSASLTAETMSGQSVAGSDAIVTIGCK